jgi:hypothetical protein
MKFDVVLSGAGTRNENNEFVFRENVQNHMRLINASGYYGMKTRNSALRKDPVVFRGLNSMFERIQTVPVGKNLSVHIWKRS